LKNLLQIDKSVIFIVSSLIAIVFFLFEGKSLAAAFFILFAILVYELIIFNKRYLYGFGGLKYLSIPSLILFSYTVFIAIPSIYVFTIKSSSAIYPYLISIILFYILFPLGLLLGNILKPIEINHIQSLTQSELIKSNFDHKYFKYLYIVFLISVIILLLYLFRVKTIPLLEMINNPGDYILLGRLREKSLKLLDMTFIETYLQHWQRNLIIPLSIVWCMFLAINYKKKKYIIVFLILFFYGLVVNSLTLEKSPVAAIIFTIFALLYLRQNKISLKFLIIALISIFAAPILIWFFLYYNADNIIKLIYVSLFERIFIVPTEVLYYDFYIFPDKHDFLLGRASQLTSWLHSDGIFPLANYVARIWWNNPLSTGYANSIFIGVFWADFGWIGVIISSFLFGVIIHLFYWLIISSSEYKKNIIYCTAISISTPIFTFNFFSSNLTTLFFTRGLILLIIFLIVYKKYRKLRRI